MTKAGLFDMHVHTEHSHDSVCPMHDKLEIACQKGLAGIAITEHCDIEYGQRDVNSIRESVNEANYWKPIYKDRLKVLAGVELGEAIWDLPLANSVLAANEYDVVIGSVHAAFFEGATEPFSHIDFSTWENDTIDAYLHQYFADVYKTVEVVDFDILAHLTCPLRYLVNKKDYHFELAKFAEQIKQILTLLIQKGRTLEVNCSGYRNAMNDAMPNKKILLMYRELGGELISLASDSHGTTDLAKPLERLVELLLECGFEQVVYYENRICHKIDIGA